MSYNSFTNDSTFSGYVETPQITMEEETTPDNTFSATTAKIYKKRGVDGLYYLVGGGTEVDLTASATTSVANSLATTTVPVDVSLSGPPLTGYVLKATSGSSATWQADSGGGNVVGPDVSTNNAVALFNLETGQLLKNSTLIYDGTNLSGPSAYEQGTKFILNDTDGNQLWGASTNALDGSAFTNTALGSDDYALTSGDDNAFFASSAGSSVSTGSRNCFYGSSAGSTAITNNDCLILGQNAQPSANGTVNEVVVGSGSVGNGSNTTTVGNINCNSLVTNGATCNLGTQFKPFNSLSMKNVITGSLLDATLNEGCQQYDVTLNKMVYSNGTAWQPMGPSAGGGDVSAAGTSTTDHYAQYSDGTGLLIKDSILSTDATSLLHETDVVYKKIGTDTRLIASSGTNTGTKCLIINNGIANNGTGSNNTVAGIGSMETPSTAFSNTVIGALSGNIIDTNIGCTLVGYDAEPSTFNTANEIVLGAGAKGAGQNKCVIGNSGLVSINPHTTATCNLGETARPFNSLALKPTATGSLLPAASSIGTIQYDTTLSEVVFSNGTEWVSVGGGGGGGNMIGPGSSLANQLCAFGGTDGKTTINSSIVLSDLTTLTNAVTLTNKTLTTPIISSISNTGTLTLPTTTDTLVGKSTNDSLTNKNITGYSNVVAASHLLSSSTSIAISTALAPAVGDVLRATSSSAATWQPIGGGSGDMIGPGSSLANQLCAFVGTDGITTYNTTLTTLNVVTLDGLSTLTNKTLTAPKISTIVNTGTLTLPTSTDTLVGKGTSDIFTNKTATATSNNITSKSLHSATTVIDVATSTAPTTGQVLTATSGTAATWQTPTGGGTGDVTQEDVSVTADTYAQYSGTTGELIKGSTLASTITDLTLGPIPIFSSIDGNTTQMFGCTGTVTANSNLLMNFNSGNSGTGANNVAIGDSALWAMGSASSNIGIGKNAGALALNSTSCICIGTDSDFSANSTTNEIILGSSVLGAGSNTCTLGSQTLLAVVPSANANCELGINNAPFNGLTLKKIVTLPPAVVGNRGLIKFDDTAGAPFYSDGATWNKMSGSSGAALPVPSLTGPLSNTEVINYINSIKSSNNEGQASQIKLPGKVGASGAYSGACYSGPGLNRIYFAPLNKGEGGLYTNNDPTLLDYIDCNTGQVVQYVHGMNLDFVNCYSGCVFSPEGPGRIYMIPYGISSLSSQYHYIDCLTGDWVAYTHGSSGTISAYSYYGGTYDPITKYIFMSPNGQADELVWHIINCNGVSDLDLIAGYTHGLNSQVNNGYRLSSYSPTEQRVYFIPYQQTTKFAYINCSTFLSTLNAGSYNPPTAFSGSDYIGAVYSATAQKIWLMPALRSTSATFHYIDTSGVPDANLIVEYAHGNGASFFGAFNWAGGCHCPLNDRIYPAPASLTSLSKYYIDCSNGEWVSYTDQITQSNGSAGSIFSGYDNKIYYIPSSNTNTYWPTYGFSHTGSTNLQLMQGTLYNGK